jgi:photosystem II stability/assembly factor-like uncharacterized protein
MKFRSASVCFVGLAATATLFATLVPSAAGRSAEAYNQYGSWRVSKIGGGGYLMNVIFTPDPKVLYAHADVAGPWRSEDGGRTWRALYGTLPPLSSYGIRGLLVDPRNANRIMVARGGGQWAPADGLYISNDGGRSWQKTLTATFNANESARASGFLLARNPRNPDEVFAAGGHEGVFRSRDNGKTWTNVGATGLFPTDLRYDRSNPKRLWLAAKEHKMWLTPASGNATQVELKGGFFRSDNSGATWNKLADEAPAEILQDPVDATRLYGLFNDGKDVRLSRDGGDRWTNLNEGLAPRDTHWMDTLNALAAGPDFILTATQRGNFFRLKAGDTQWQKIERQGVQETYEGRSGTLP